MLQKISERFLKNGSNKIIIIFVVAYIISSYLLYANIPISPDEGNTLFTAKKFNEGLVPYKDIKTDIKMPGLYYVSYVIIKLFGTDYIFPRLFMIAINVVSVFLVFLIAKKLFDDKIAFLSSTFFIFVSLLPGYNLFLFLSDNFSIFFILLSLYFFTLSDKKINLFLAGIFCGIAFTFKQVSGFMIPFYFVYFIIKTIKFREMKKSVKKLSIILLSFFIPIAIIAIHFYSMGALVDMIYWTTAGTANYSSLFTIGSFFERMFSLQTAYIISTISFIWVISFSYFIFILYKILKNKFNMNEALLFSYIITMSYFFVTTLSYFMQLLPILCIMTAAGLYSLKEMSKNSFTKIFVFTLISIMILLSFAVNIYSEINLQKLSVTLKKDYDSTASFIKNATQKNDKIFVFSYSPQIYYLSERDPPGNYPRYLYPNDEQINESDEFVIVDFLRKNKAKYIIADSEQKTREYNPIIYDFIVSDYLKERNIGRFEIYKIRA